MSIVLIQDTSVAKAVAAQDKKIVIRSSSGPAVLRSSLLDGSGEVALYYEAPNGKVDNPSTDDDGNAIVINATNPERIINVPGTYRVAVITASTSAGQVFVDR